MRSEINCQLPETDRFYSQRFESDRTPSGVEDRLAKDSPTSRGSLVSVYDLRSTYATRLSAGCVAAEWVTQLLRQGDLGTAQAPPTVPKLCQIDFTEPSLCQNPKAFHWPAG